MTKEDLERDVRYLALDVLALVNGGNHIPEGLEKAKRKMEEALRALRPEPQATRANA